MANQEEARIRARLRARGAWLVEAGDRPMEEARTRADLSRAIADAYPAFEALRDVALGRAEYARARDAALLRLLAGHGLVETHAGRAVAAGAVARRYLSGGWLEELVFLAAEAAGADEALVGQRVRWRAGGHEGENEIDVLARFGERLAFFSCKALAAEMEREDQAHRKRLMSALDEVDNLMDHFGGPQDKAALVVSTDLFAEEARLVRYEQLHGKAAALRVSLISLERLGWADLVRAVSA
ncbi:Card1-like endonuclease domain-containing protein [Xanthobacter sp. AM11]|uniref:Card1-like endonuclease domain-containing protein n=1 Tax=Xanthobacter sp. AM11 TaxID=3380643 RepID=UPI0039BF8B9E